jgi:hypothetical protein
LIDTFSIVEYNELCSMFNVLVSRWWNQSRSRERPMELVWLVLTLIAVDLAALRFAADTRPGLQHSSRHRLRRRSATG